VSVSRADRRPALFSDSRERRYYKHFRPPPRPRLVLVRFHPFARHAAEPPQIAASRPAAVTPAFQAPETTAPLARAATSRSSSESPKAATAPRDTARVATHALWRVPQVRPTLGSPTLPLTNATTIPLSGRRVLPLVATEQPDAAAQALLPRGGPAYAPGFSSGQSAGMGVGAGRGVAGGILVTSPHSRFRVIFPSSRQSGTASGSPSTRKTRST